MNYRDIRRLAQEAGFPEWFANPDSGRGDHSKIVTRFAKLVSAYTRGAAIANLHAAVADEREACVKTCDQIALLAFSDKTPYRNCASAIRARSGT